MRGPVTIVLGVTRLTATVPASAGPPPRYGRTRPTIRRAGRGEVAWTSAELEARIEAKLGKRALADAC